MTLLAPLLALTFAVAGEESATFANPVAMRGADPWVVYDGGRYHYCFSRRNSVWVASDDDLLGVFSAQPVLAWRPDRGHAWSRDVWAPELHRLGDAWYIYVAADDGQNENHRMQVLQRKDANPAGTFQRMGELHLPEDKWAIDGTVLQHNGRLYYVWSGWPDDVNVTQRLYICAMSDPATPFGPRVEISRPNHDWEKIGNPTVNEGPEALTHEGRTFVVYSASGSWGDHYCLGMLELVGDDPLQGDAWQKRPQPVFAGTPQVISPGHASFTTAGDRHWIVYHVARHAGAGWDRLVHMQPFEFDAGGRPVFGQPQPPGTPIERPQPSEGDR
ncbi:MAG: glycoside hydrolase family 43 protein [Planctomycetales bacterium]|nr:glycoside hydrolase family 43 protein [Planctomycetales bacterium]